MTTTTLTKNTDLLKQEVHEHITADAVVQGNYWSDGKGCFIGCLTHSGDSTPAVERFGLTECILRIAECIFESLPLEEAKQFFFDFPDAVATDGKDLSLIHWAFLGETLRNLPPQRPEIQAVIDPVIDGMDLLASGNVWEIDARAAASVAASVATASAWAARAAASVAARAAASAWAARPVTRAATRAACAACAAAGDAASDAASCAASDAAGDAASGARDAETRRQRESLLRLIREAPVVTPSPSPRKAPEGATKEQSSLWRDPRLYPKEEISDGQYIEAARLAVQHLGHISIAETPYVERTDDGLGAYVSAQIWVPITNSTP
jgi:hypothetical protein